MNPFRKTFDLPAATVLIVSLCFLAVVLLDRPVESFDESSAGDKWEYHTTTVTTLDLQTELDKLASGGWEVFSVIRHESELVQEAGTNYIRASQIGITAKRLSR